MMHQIRYALRDPSFSGPLGGVEADETYIAGRVRGKKSGYKGNKTPVVALVERKGRVRSIPVERVSRLSWSGGSFLPVSRSKSLAMASAIGFARFSSTLRFSGSSVMSGKSLCHKRNVVSRFACPTRSMRQSSGRSE